MKHFIVFIISLLALHLYAIGQDSVQVRRGVSTDRSQPHTGLNRRSGSDSTRVGNDSLRNDLRKVNLTFLSNIRTASMAEFVAQLNEKSNSYASTSANSAKDSVATIKNSISEEIRQLKSIKGSIANYSNSLSGTKDQIRNIVNHYDISANNHARAHQYLNSAELKLSSKMDSLEMINRTIDELILKNQRHLNRLDLITETKTAAKKSTTAPGKSSIWKANTTSISKDVILDNIRSNYSNNKSIDKYVNRTDWASRILLIVLGLAYSYWIVRVAYVLKQNDPSNKIAIDAIVGKTIIFLLTLLPFVNFFTPTFILQASQLVIMLIFMYLLRHKMTGQQRKIALILIIFYLLDVFVNMIVSDDLFLRIVCIGFNLIALGLVSYTKRRIKNPESPGYISNFIYVVFAILNITAITLNVIGHVEHSRSFSIACAVGLVQSFTLQYFADMIKLDVRNQFKKDRLVAGFWMRFNEQRTLTIITEILRIVCILLAIIVLANNLQFIETLLALSETFFGKVRSIGSISFTLGNLVVAILLLLVANWFQKNISLIVLGGEDGQLNQAYNQKMTLFPLFRLAIILIGFFIAISALGMSLDKLTVVIGALSVGIGLGMQNIINNFVSGIILVFDKPFRVGDQIELADKKGRVKEIGIRASVLKTADGADVIIPNGDLLSGRLVNWTLSQEYSRTSFVLHIDRKTDLDEAKQWINAAIAASPHFVKERDSGISVQDISEEMIYLSVFCWVNFAANASSLKNDVLVVLYKQFEEKGLKFYSVLPPKS
ncbi:mechanosensitive ion channel family protein [Sphingobacterium sp. BIGb0165]|uniref:mechanosensitive ion channel family protein n=1 Tax=Sphingobacterium sp. BIGb0165 TaxID=2940615 RepID=UPI00216A3EC3|nr:mechanosensitive ion channel domain-containing protein [Sphingobacterium sp. BIGb0165]MCS4225607.1 small-conductance mechanosensitive channel [Sphingobacterium sp. BIGb0165]